eukprot:TRINITY_DN18798_c0_g1_i1.p1 TRINITY_DN18798_c0_g1~~TRINITY_DN18798_c0_g1_i1.p1  ORF type:complete len:120 (+),score=25.20 TRINITY_DN18798_c0_g1_i1:38-361(+)
MGTCPRSTRPTPVPSCNAYTSVTNVAMRVFKPRYILSVGLLFLTWYCWPVRQGKRQGFSEVLESSQDYYDYDTDGEQRSSSSFTSPSRSGSSIYSASDNLYDLPKPY